MPVTITLSNCQGTLIPRKSCKVLCAQPPEMTTTEDAAMT